MPSIPLPTLPGVYYARVLGTAELRPSTNIITMQVATPPPDAATDAAWAHDVAAGIALAWQTHILPIMSDTYNMNGVEVYPLGHPLVPKQTVINPGAGTQTGAITSLASAYAINHSVSRRGRGSQSRTSLTPVLLADMNTDGRSIVSTKVTAITAAYALFVSSLLTELTTVPGGVWQYTQLSKGHLPTPVGATFPIVSSNAEALMTTQRKRVQRRSG